MSKCEIIAEIGQAHDGSLGILLSLIDAAADSGVDTVKFQVHIAECESSVHDEFRVKFSPADDTRKDYWKRMELTEEQWAVVKARCEEKGCGFLATPFSVEAIEMLERIGCPRYKVGSGDVTNELFLRRLAETKKPIILSSGLSTLQEVESAVRIIEMYGCTDYMVLQCTSEYPVPPSRWGLKQMLVLKEKLSCKVGLSDHSGTAYAGLAAVSIGASAVEVHITFSKKMFGPDALASLELRELKMLVEGAAAISEAFTSDFDKEQFAESNQRMRIIFGRSLVARRELMAGSVLTIEDLEAVKPSGFGLPPTQLDELVGKEMACDVEKGGFITEECLV
ncbi:N-acetylneuraminate synthase family protein [Aliamphritea ceti]|uniref:N-acetylneuraminate synthase family protein n=1 Tax=Aliamphritea ceti TaxID=1524258 RepID=UPI0021C413B2|nr:N-acetylneuraminate synthase family protein [Aliamphritea ceti]